jgi:L,D-transpeptidase ErfK/SrfK
MGNYKLRIMITVILKRKLFKAGIFLLVALIPYIVYAASMTAPQKIVGSLDTYRIQSDETLYDVARSFEVGIDELMYANLITDPWFPGAGTELIIPSMHILPSKPHKGIIIDKTALRLYYFPGDTANIISFPVALGKPGYETPIGTTKIIDKKANPFWKPSPRVRIEYPDLDLPAIVPPGPGNPLGEYAIYLGWDLIVIHGTNDPWTVGSHVSRGCVRMYPEHIKILFGEVNKGTEVRVVDEPVRIGWLNNRLYLAVYPTRVQKDRIDLRKNAGFPEDVEAIKRNLANIAESYRVDLDWNKVNTALQEYRGIPVRISK